MPPQNESESEVSVRRLPVNREGYEQRMVPSGPTRALWAVSSADWEEAARIPPVPASAC